MTGAGENSHLSSLLMPITRNVSRGETVVSAGYYKGHEKVSFSVTFLLASLLSDSKVPSGEAERDFRREGKVGECNLTRPHSSGSLTTG